MCVFNCFKHNDWLKCGNGLLVENGELGLFNLNGSFFVYWWLGEKWLISIGSPAEGCDVRGVSREGVERFIMDVFIR